MHGCAGRSKNRANAEYYSTGLHMSDWAFCDATQLIVKEICDWRHIAYDANDSLSFTLCLATKAGSW